MPIQNEECLKVQCPVHMENGNQDRGITAYICTTLYMFIFKYKLCSLAVDSCHSEKTNLEFDFEN